MSGALEEARNRVWSTFKSEDELWCIGFVHCCGVWQTLRRVHMVIKERPIRTKRLDITKCPELAELMAMSCRRLPA